MKKLVVMLAAVLNFQKGQTVELDATTADELIAKGHAVQVDPSVKMRDHATPPGNSDLANVVAQALGPVVTEVKNLTARVDDLAKGPRAKSTSNAAGITDTATEPNAKEEPIEVRVARAVAGEMAQRASTGGVRVVGRADDGTGMRLARYIRAAARAQQLGIGTEDVLDSWKHGDDAKIVREKRMQVFRGMGATVERATLLSQSTLADGGALIPEQFAADLIPLLRNATRVRQAGARVITMDGGNLTLPKQTGATTASYVGENQADTLSKPQFGDIKFAEKKMRVGVVLSNDLIRNSSLDADMLTRDDMVSVAAIKEDSQALFGLGSQYSPIGVENLIDSTRKINSSAADRTNPTLAETRKDLSKIIKLFKQTNYPIGPNSKIGWIMNSRYEAFLGSIVDGNGNAVYLQGLDNGMLRNYPVFVTEQIADNLAGFNAVGTTDECRVFFGAWDTFVIAESAGGMQVKVFPDGTYEDSNGNAISGASRDQTYVRLILLHDFNMRYTNTIVDTSNRPA